MSNYYEKDAISQSKIKKFIESKSEYKSIYVDKFRTSSDTDNMKFGRLYHNYLYEASTMKDRYLSIPNSTIVGNMMGILIERMADGLSTQEAYTLAGFKLPFDTVVKQFRENPKNQDYYNLLLEAQGKTIISDMDKSIVKKMKEVYIKDNHILHKAKSKEWSIFPEQEIFFTSSSSSLDLKMKADCIYIHPEFKEVYIEDLKTTEDLNLQSFIYSMKRYRYDIQQSFYKLGVQHWIENKFNIVIPYDKIKFVFIPQRKQYPYEILDFIEVDSISEDKAYTDWTTALIDLETCLVTNNWEKDKSIYEEGRKIVKLW